MIHGRQMLVIAFSLAIGLAGVQAADVASSPSGDNPQLAALKLIPWPQSVELNGGDMTLTKDARIVCADGSLMPLARILSDEVAKVTGLRLAALQGTARAGDIALSIDAKLKDEAYTLTVADQAAVVGADYNAVAMGTATLLQAIASQEGKVTLPKLTIHDQPGLKYCGAMLDIARKPHSIATLKQCVDIARFYKVRFIHLHMSDENAWTFPSTKYPQLGKGNYAWAGGDACKVYPIQELKDLVAYGDARGVTFVPEIETPGHSAQLRGSLPEIFGYRTEGGQIESPGVTNIASPEALAALDTLVGEFAEVFKSSPYIHMGSDESGVGGIEKYPAVKAVMAKENLKNSTEVFAWYINQMNTMVKKRGKQMIVWQDAPVGATTDKSVIIMPWREGSNSGPGYRSMGFRTIEAQTDGPFTRGDPKQLGATSLQWQYTEDVSLTHMRYIASRRTEPPYNPELKAGPTDFIRRQAMLEPTLDKVLAGFALAMKGAIDPTVLNRMDPMFTNTLTLAPQGTLAGGKIRYTLDESEPIFKSPVLTKPLTLNSSAIIKARWFSDDGKTALYSIVRQYRRLTAVKHDAIGAKVTLNPALPSIPPAMLADGLMAAGDSYNDPGWVAWSTPGAKEITLELKKPTAIRNIRGHFDNAGFGLILPAKVEMAVSDDGTTFRSVGTMDSATAWKNRGWFSVELPQPVTAQYVRLTATPGGDWTFVDEVMVNGDVPGPNFPHAAVGKAVTTTTPPIYKAPGLEALTDGTIGNTPQYACLGFVGFGQGIVSDVTIDMGKPTDIKVVGGHFVQEAFAGVWIPSKVEVLASNDGKEFRPIGTITHPQDKRGNALETLKLEVRNVKARYVKFKFAGGEWNIADEFFVNPTAQGK